MSGAAPVKWRTEINSLPYEIRINRLVLERTPARIDSIRELSTPDPLVRISSILRWQNPLLKMCLARFLAMMMIPARLNRQS